MPTMEREKPEILQKLRGMGLPFTKLMAEVTKLSKPVAQIEGAYQPNNKSRVASLFLVTSDEKSVECGCIIIERVNLLLGMAGYGSATNTTFDSDLIERSIDAFDIHLFCIDSYCRADAELRSVTHTHGMQLMPKSQHTMLLRGLPLSIHDSLDDKVIAMSR